MYFARSGVVIGGYYRHREASRFHLPRSIITQQSAPSRGLSGQGAKGRSPEVLDYVPGGTHRWR
jgi:hypothetical protein